MKISVVVPVYSCNDCLKELIQRLFTTLNKITTEFEIILINDNSPDNSWSTIKELANQYTYIKGINLSRNFGQHYAITAGLQHVKGEWIVVMDCDLQDRPEEIINLYNKSQEEFDLVFAKRVVRKDSFLKKLSSNLFYKILSYLTGIKQDSSIANFGIYNKKVINAILEMNDYIKYFPTMSQWVGFNKTKINVVHSKREYGTTSYSWRKLIKLAFDNITTFSTKILELIVKFGFLVVIITLLFTLYFFYKYFNNEILISGYTSLILSIWLLSGIIMIILGVLGIYIGRIFEQVKDRPTYIINEKINL